MLVIYRKLNCSVDTKLLQNFTNHPSAEWTPEQTAAARVFADRIENIPFPQVPAEWDAEQVKELAVRYVDELAAKQPVAVLCQGEFTLVYHVVQGLKRLEIPVYAACSQRNTVTQGNKKISVFNFVRFRAY
ncbi:MAG: hypothetical protein ACOX55_06145 [Christensenellales bacterium]